MKTPKAIFPFLALCISLCAVAGCSPEPAKVEIIPEKVILEGADASLKLQAKVLDKDGKDITKDVDLIWFSEDTKRIKLATDGTVSAIESGETEVEAEVVGTGIKGVAPVRVKIPASIAVSHERLRLWTGQVKENVWAEVHSEKGAFIEGYYPTWISDDPEIVKLEPINDPGRRQSWVKMTGMKSGTTYVYTRFKHLSERIRVAVFDEDEEVALDGTRITKEQKEAMEAEKAKKDKKK